MHNEYGCPRGHNVRLVYGLLFILGLFHLKTWGVCGVIAWISDVGWGEARGGGNGQSPFMVLNGIALTADEMDLKLYHQFVTVSCIVHYEKFILSLFFINSVYSLTACFSVIHMCVHDLVVVFNLHATFTNNVYYLFVHMALSRFSLYMYHVYESKYVN